LLLGAIAGASRLVTPPPPLPKPEKPAAAQPTAAERARSFKLEEENRKKEMTKYTKSGGLPVMEDPNKIEPTNKYFTEVKPGPAGFDQNDKALAKKTAEYKKYLALKAKEPAPVPGKSSEILPPPP